MVMPIQNIATPVLRMSSALKVGVGAGPQADNDAIVSTATIDRIFLFIFFSAGEYFYHKEHKGTQRIFLPLSTQSALTSFSFSRA
jgi:hypothetical protein